jgi:RNA polymerase sigma factor (sigma-70 family)
VDDENATVTWNDVPADLQERVIAQGAPGIADLASWAYENRPGWVRNDDLHDVLGALLVFLRRGPEGGRERRLQSLPALLNTIAYRQRCQRYRDKAYERRAQSTARQSREPDPPVARLERIEMQGIVRDALHVLTPMEREVLFRKHVFEQSYKVIARCLFGKAGKKEEGRVSVLLTRGRRKLRRELTEAPG